MRRQVLTQVPGAVAFACTGMWACGMRRSAARARRVAWEPQDMSLRVAGKRTI
ncbi:MAG: hypothetical protein SPF66_05045 [Bacteroidaceae bacterium]|nr:hypothetical protein [Bacteroidaceae bacterium]